VKISVFTPSHDPQFLDAAAASMLAQTHTDFEWIVLMNGGATWQGPDDPRVRVLEGAVFDGVGAAKREACAAATGEILVELDHDDVLATEALQRIAEAFDDYPEVVFVYSNMAQINVDGSRNDGTYGLEHGKVYREAVVDGQSVYEAVAMATFPSAVSRIWLAPNHVRAFRREAYEEVGGYNPEFHVLDDLDLLCRLYQHGAFHHIDECLYLQRVHPGNTQAQPERADRVSLEISMNYERHLQANALAWATREGLLAIDLGAAHRKPPGYLGVDIVPGTDIQADLNGRLPFEDNSVGVIRAVDVIDLIEDKVALFNELYRILAHGGVFLCLTPSADGRGAFQNPASVAFYNENSFSYITDASMAGFVPPITCRFQVSHMVTRYLSAWHQEHKIPYVNVNLVALKDGPRVPGIITI